MIKTLLLYWWLLSSTSTDGIENLDSQPCAGFYTTFNHFGCDIQWPLIFIMIILYFLFRGTSTQSFFVKWWARVVTHHLSVFQSFLRLQFYRLTIGDEPFIFIMIILYFLFRGTSTYHIFLFCKEQWFFRILNFYYNTIILCF